MKAYALSIILLFLYSIPAFAQDEELAEFEAAKMDVRIIEIDGEFRIAFTRVDAKALLQMRLDLPKVELKVEALTKLLTNTNLQATESERLAKNALEQKDIMGKENIALNEMISSFNDWYRNPWFLVCIGLVGGTGITIGIVFAVR